MKKLQTAKTTKNCRGIFHKLTYKTRYTCTPESGEYADIETGGLSDGDTQIGKSELMTSALALGLLAIGGRQLVGDNDDQMSVDNHSQKPLESWGIREIDTAIVYGYMDDSEKWLAALKESTKRSGDHCLRSVPSVVRTEGGISFSRDVNEVTEDLVTEGHPERFWKRAYRLLEPINIDVYYTHWQCKTYGVVPWQKPWKNF